MKENDTPIGIYVAGGASRSSGEGKQIPLTPTSVEGVRALFEGFCAMAGTLEQGAPASAAIAVTPSVLELLEHCCGDDPRYGRVAANLFVVSRQHIIAYHIRDGQEPPIR